MAINWDSSEHLAAVAVGCLALVAPPVAATTGAIVGAAALVGMWRKAKAKLGLDDRAFLAEAIGKTEAAMQMIYAGDWAAEADIAAADRAMAVHLADCIPDKATLGSLVLDQATYPDRAAQMVVELLARRDALFSTDRAGASELARRFATEAVKNALTAALERPDYSQALVPFMLTAIGKGVATVVDTTARIEAGQSAQGVVLDEQTGLLRELVAAKRAEAGRQNVSEEALIALARRVAEKVEDAGQALAELEQAIESFLAIREAAARGTNLGELVDRTMAGMAAANERLDFDAAAREGARGFEDWEAKFEAERQGGLKLIEANIEQARLRRDVKGAVDWVCRR